MLSTGTRTPGPNTSSHCVNHRENLVSKKCSPVLNKILNSVIKCINSMKANAKCESLPKQFCEDKNADHVRLLVHTEVRWLSQGNCLRRFIELSDILSEFLNVGWANIGWTWNETPTNWWWSSICELFDKMPLKSWICSVSNCKKQLRHLLIQRLRYLDQRLRYLDSLDFCNYVRRMLQPRILTNFIG